MKNKKKIIAIVVSIVLVVVVSTSVILITSGEKVQGTQAAKVLLARENMTDGETSFDWEKIFTDTPQEVLEQSVKHVNALSTGFTRNVMPLNNGSSTKDVNLGTLVHDSAAGKVYKNNGQYVFQNINGASYQGLVIESRLDNIDFRVENAAKNINYLKNELNIVNKWVEDGYNKYYLDVTENKETLMNYYEDDRGIKSLWVVERETREDANSVYTLMYTGMENAKLENPTYLVYIPNERYEYYYGHDGNGSDHIIAENDRGYWNVFNPHESYFRNVTISDNFAFESAGNYGEDGNGDYGSIVTPDLKEQIISNHGNGVSFNLSAFNGISGIYAPEDICFEDTYDGEKIYIDVNYDDRLKLKVKLESGDFLAVGDEFSYSEGTVKIVDTTFDFYPNPGFADPQYDMSFTLEMGENLSLREKLNLFEVFLKDKNLTCKYDLNDIEKSIVKNSEISNSLTSFYTWNGYPIDSAENVAKSEQVIFDKIEDMFSEYEKIKDAELVSKFSSPKLARRQSFAKIGNVNIGSATYADAKIEINDLSITVGKSNLLETDKKYRLQIGLARIDKNGKFLSQNTVNLATLDNVSSENYSGSDLTLSASGVYDIPSALEENRYVVVAYAVTDDERIRVSEMKAIAFVDTVSDTIENSFVKININNVDGNLIVEYSTKLYFNIALSGEIDYATLRRKMMAQALKHGYPIENEEIKNQNGDIITEGTILNGEYKLRFTISTAEGVVTGYVVCTVSV